MTRWIHPISLALLLLGGLPPGPAAAQETRRAVVGAVVGVAGGGVVTLSAIVARARFQREYMDSAEDLIHWLSIPMIAAPAVGVVFGLAGPKAHVGSIIGSTTGMVVGAAVGTGLGWLLSEDQEAPWAGGVIGAGVGLTLGGLMGGFRGWEREEDPGIAFPDLPLFTISIPAP
ncbi:MAG TPA: hypothetical protein VF234_00600 [Limnochordia bacterium]